MCQIDWNAVAAWVQAFGTIGAVIAAIWIDRGDARRARRERDAEKKERFSAAELSIRTALNAILWAQTQFDTAISKQWAFEPAEPLARVSAAEALLTHYIDNPNSEPRVVYALVMARRRLPPLIKNLSGLKSGEERESSLAANFDAARKGAEEALQELDHGPIASAAGNVMASASVAGVAG
jgi:hypothetical protein